MLKIIYMGTPDFAVPALEKISSKYEVGYVVTQEDKPKNRGKKLLPTPVKEKALSLGLEVLQPAKIKGNDEFIEIIKEYAPDVICVAAYGKILPKELLDIPKYGCFNIHASLLPRHRGAAPIQKVILDGDEYAGVTIMKMAEGLDTGDMIIKGKTPVEFKTCGMLTLELSDIGAELMMDVLSKIEKGEDIPLEKQNDELSTYAGMISKADAKINWEEEAVLIERQIRAMNPSPGAFTKLGEDTMKIWEAEVISQDSQKQPGTITEVSDEGIKIVAGENMILAKVIQMPGKKKMNVKDFLRGNKIEVNHVLL